MTKVWYFSQEHTTINIFETGCCCGILNSKEKLYIKQKTPNGKQKNLFFLFQKNLLKTNTIANKIVENTFSFFYHLYLSS